MVSILPEAIFVHVPKNAGSSISDALPWGVSKAWPMHVPWACLEDNGKPGFGFIRDPWARMVSLYFFLLRSPSRHLQRVDPDELRSMGFKRWLLEGRTYQSNEPIDGEIFLRQNAAYLPVSKSNTYKNLDKLIDKGFPPMQRRPSMWWLEGLPMENVGKVESLQADIESIAERLGFSKPVVLLRNVTKTKPENWQGQYDSETIDFVAQMHKPDIDAGGYKPPF